MAAKVRQQKIENQIIKTALLVGGLSVLLLPLDILNIGVGLILSLTLIALFINYLHNVGKNTRFISHYLVKTCNFFINDQEIAVRNTIENILVGGENVFDQLFSCLADLAQQNSPQGSPHQVSTQHR